jgi:hypothetical protein
MHLRVLDLVISEAERLQLAVVSCDLLLELNDTRIVFVTFVTLDEAAIKLNDPGKRKFRALGVVEAAYSLNNLARVSNEREY